MKGAQTSLFPVPPGKGCEFCAHYSALKEPRAVDDVEGAYIMDIIDPPPKVECGACADLEDNQKTPEMKRAEITKILSSLTERHICPHQDPRIYWAREVTFDYATDHSVRVDFMKFKPINNTVSGIEKGDFFCFEVKSSVEDYRSKHGHNFIGDYNYYVMPAEVYKQVKDEIPWHVGVFCPNRTGTDIECVKKARRSDRERSCSEMLLMMFRSAARDRISTQLKLKGQA